MADGRLKGKVAIITGAPVMIATLPLSLPSAMGALLLGD